MPARRRLLRPAPDDLPRRRPPAALGRRHRVGIRRFSIPRRAARARPGERARPRHGGLVRLHPRRPARARRLRAPGKGDGRSADRRHLRGRGRAHHPLPRRRSARRRADGEPAERRHPRNDLDEPGRAGRGVRLGHCRALRLSQGVPPGLLRPRPRRRLREAGWPLGRAPLPPDRRDDLARRDDRGPARDLRLPRRPAADGASRDPPDAVLLARRGGAGGRLGLRRLLPRLPNRPAARPGGGGPREPAPRVGRGRDRAPAGGRPPGVVSAVLPLCFTASGAAALELLWMRSAGLVLGATAPTVATVLGCYFAGLGLGAAAGCRPSARPVRRYALLELGAAAATLWSVAVLHALALPAAQPALAAGGAAARVGAVAVAVLPATICLGATLPAIGDALVLPGAVGWRG